MILTSPTIAVPSAGSPKLRAAAAAAGGGGEVCAHAIAVERYLGLLTTAGPLRPVAAEAR